MHFAKGCSDLDFRQRIWVFRIKPLKVTHVSQGSRKQPGNVESYLRELLTAVGLDL